VGAGSHRHNERVKVFRGHGQLVVLERKNISLDRLADIHDGLFTVLALRNATRKTGTLGHPKTVFARINNYLPHTQKLTARFAQVKGTGGANRRLCSTPARLPAEAANRPTPALP